MTRQNLIPSLNPQFRQLKDALQKILSGQNCGFSFEELYGSVHTLSMEKSSGRLFKCLEDLLDKHLQTKVRAEILASRNNNFLQNLNAAWRGYRASILAIKDIFMFMECVSVNQMSVERLGWVMFHQKVVRDEAVSIYLRFTLLNMLDQDRKGREIDRLAVKNACQVWYCIDDSLYMF